MMEELELNAYLLHSRPYQDHKVIAEFLTEQQGKLSAVVYLGKSQKSNKKALLQPFLPLKIVVKGNNTLKTLSRIESETKSYLLTGDYLYSGFYLNELQVRLLGEHIPAPHLYDAYQQSIECLAQQQNIETILRQFEAVLLDELGLTIDYSAVFEQSSPYFYYLPESGFVPAEQNKSGCFAREHLLSIAQQEFVEPNVRQVYKLLMRQVFNHLLGGKPLNSRKLFTRN